MTDVWVEGLDGGRLSLIRDRNFAVYDVGAVRPLSDVLLFRAQEQENVYFYDLGCGEGHAAQDIFDVLVQRAQKLNFDPFIVARIHYVGIDAVAGDQWEENTRITFIEGNLEHVLKKKLPKIDLGLSYYVLPYVGDKISAVQQIYFSLAQDGSATIDPFHLHQIVDQEGNHIDPSAFLPEGSWSILGDSLCLHKVKELKTRPPIFSHKTLDMYQYVPKKGYYKGYPGQLVSHYKVE